MPEKNENAGKLEKTQIILSMIFIANNQAAEVVQPGEESWAKRGQS